MTARRLATALTLLIAVSMPALTGCKPDTDQATPAPAAVGEDPALAAKALNVLALPGADASPFVNETNFVTKWLVLGPFTFGESDFGGDQQQAAADKEFIANEAALNGTQAAPEKTTWKAQQFKEGTEAGQVDLDKMFGGIDHACAYAVAWVECPRDITDAKLMVGSDDYIRVWINGKQVLDYKTERRGSTWDQNVAEGIKLNKGLNRVVVKCTDVLSNWDFYLRFTDKDKKAVTMTVK